jgi:glycosyltransferase involved in cell wall biosynthesis
VSKALSPGSSVTIVLPTYNRARFLPSAFESIAAQTFTDWTLVIVDDGSTDATREIADRFAASCARPVKYVYQPNRGAYSARNTGLDHSDGEYIAFFDSDDTWLPHHLERCVRALQEHQDVDWVYGSCRMIDAATDAVLQPNTFYVDRRPRPFLALRMRADRDLRIIDDPGALECQMLHGLYCGLQNSVIRRRVFERHRFVETSKVVDDQHFVLRALAEGRRLAYFLEPHVIYRVHDDNSSVSGTGNSIQKHIDVFRELVTGLERLDREIALTRSQRRALNKRLSRIYFWQLGYLGFWQSGRRAEAIAMFQRSLSLWPWGVSRWKTYLLCRLRTAMSHG